MSSPSFGYFGAGVVPGTPATYVTTIERLDYSSDTTTPLIRGTNVATDPYGVMATGNRNFGYFAGSYGGVNQK